MNANYCPVCGEKRLSPDALTLRSLFQQFIAVVFNVDNKLWRSLRLLFLQPGQMTVDFAQGRRMQVMRPFQLFVLVNLVFFLTLTDADLFRAPAKWYFQNEEVSTQVEQLMMEQDMSRDELTILYDQASSGWAKGLIVILIPAIALILGFFLWGRPIGLHVVFAAHFLSFFLGYLLVVALVMLPFVPVHRFVLQGAIVGGIMCYHLFALPRVYGVRGWRVGVLAALLTFLLVGLILGYRWGISAFSLWQLS